MVLEKLKMSFLEKIIRILNQGAAWIAGAGLVGMVFLTVGNMIAREVYVPFGGHTEVVAWIGSIVAAFALGYAQLGRSHVAVDMFVRRFPSRWQMIADSLSSFMSMALFGITAWRAAIYAGHVWELGTLSGTLKVIFFPFIYLVAIGCGLLSLVLLVDLLKSAGKARNK